MSLIAEASPRCGGEASLARVLVTTQVVDRKSVVSVDDRAVADGTSICSAIPLRHV